MIRVTVEDHNAERDFHLDGAEASIKEQLVKHFPWLADAAEGLSLYELVEYLDSQQGYSAYINADAEAMHRMLAGLVPEPEAPRVADAPVPEPSPHGADPLPHGMKEFWEYPEDED